ncbi:MAG: lipid A export permease/ATP-binding protein MsbA [Gammaproteobacteria bacterium]|nr:lipid A export permease/ATP-binding protein MsbA [Gammaproteobacteria bacterium]
MRYSAPYWPIFAGAALATVLFAAVDTAFMALMKPLMDGTFVERDTATIRWIPLAIVGLFVARGVTGFASTYGMAWVGRRVTKDLRCEVFERVLRLPMKYFDRSSAGRLQAGLTYNVEQVAEAATTALNTLVKEGLTIVGFVGLMFWLNWRLALFSFFVAPLMALVIRYVTKRFRRISQRLQESVGTVSEATQEAVHAQRVIKIQNAQDTEQRHFDEANNRNRQLSMKLVATQASSSAVIQFIGAWAVAAIVYFATQPEMIAKITPGTFAAFMGAMLGLMNPMKAMSNVNMRIQKGIVAAANIFELMAEQAEPQGGSRPLARAQGRIEFHDVRFRYRDDAADVLKGITLDVPAGSTVAFVGRPGSGKSTLLSLLPRFYETDGGAIRLDGHDIRDYGVRDLRRQVALVDQQVRLFNATVAENVAYGLDPMPLDERIVEACKQAHAWEFVQKLPQGIHTHVGQNGVLLSGGQRQRIAIARALLKDAPILILDEATSALDTESERYIQQAFERLVAGRTTLVIAHRLSTIQRADLIAVMQDGRLVETGRHEDLLARNGLYAALYRMQFEHG